MLKKVSRFEEIAGEEVILAHRLMKTGAIMSDKLNKDLFAVITKDLESNSKKAKFGKEHNILYSITQFNDKYLV